MIKLKSISFFVAFLKSFEIASSVFPWIGQWFGRERDPHSALQQALEALGAMPSMKALADAEGWHC
ncbi:hypothetical protein NXC12_CH02662 [Rhizobium etli]|uniref:Uncharacterized protein n=1 Tax=Rhizobium etli TaxID=29449 RepID=A0AAN1BG72_RHIET|nr:hypothetical protein NXC12_CH02662 [Rhizobium etli]